jgi:SAM-dependent methyltransferase
LRVEPVALGGAYIPLGQTQQTARGLAHRRRVPRRLYGAERTVHDEPPSRERLIVVQRDVSRTHPTSVRRSAVPGRRSARPCKPVWSISQHERDATGCCTLAGMLRRLYEATWGRSVAWAYDWFMSSTENAGLRDRRRELLGSASGRCLEVGAGTGINLELWPDSVESLVLSEPDRHMAAQLRKHVARSGRPAQVVEAPGERLPFDDASFDSIAMTLVLCTAPDPPAVLREVRRVLKPQGRVLFLEHVRAEDPRLARWQDRLHGPWYVFGYGCNCNRDTLATIEASPLDVERVERGRMPKAPPIVRPMIWGVASPTEPAAGGEGPSALSDDRLAS